MMMLDSSQIDEDFNEDIFCDSCHQLWPEEIYIDHWEICMQRNVPKIQIREQQYFRQQRRKAPVNFRDKGEEKQKKQKRTGRGRRYQNDEHSPFQQKQMVSRVGRTINTQKKETPVQNIDIATPTRNIPIYEPTRNTRNIPIYQPTGNTRNMHCNQCGRSMDILSYEAHTYICDGAKCPYCQQTFTSQLIIMHKSECRLNNGSHPQPQPQASRPRPSQPAQNYPMPQLTTQFLEYLLSQWNDAKNKDKGLSDTEIRELRTEKYEKKGEQGDTCTVCQDDIEDGNDCVHLQCKHIFHPQCIKQWVKKIALCPNCKFNIKEGVPNSNK